MIRKYKPVITAALCAIAFGWAWAQAPQFATFYRKARRKEASNEHV
jgi:hypothetical protein